ncbi:hypothetical protein [Brasilonema sp. UFV-L1]|uniref:hypothetical protein n=1 Tax=Brasilonema sp. UFV-L1 TaxID=2234130 RepID=UPI00145C67A3|nr:hypothetical protein [Brasilonema sp. UFV-L1]NMG10012.1 hypothetical protein [Brasilonema sp. UFV-L1]
MKGIANEVIVRSKEIVSQSKAFRAQSKKVVSQSKAFRAQSKKIVSQSKIFRAKSKEVVSRAKAFKAIYIELGCQFIANKAHYLQIKMHQEQIKQFKKAKTVTLIEYGSQKQVPLFDRYTIWLTQHGYSQQAIVTSAARGEIQYELEIFASEHEVFALYVELQSKQCLYHAIPDFDIALRMLNSVKESLQVD